MTGKRNNCVAFFMRYLRGFSGSQHTFYVQCLRTAYFQDTCIWFFRIYSYRL